MSAPTDPASSGRVSPLALLIVGAIVLFGGVLAYNGVAMLVQRQTGERVDATVTKCVDSGSSRNRRTACVGSWKVDGVLHTGTVQGATSDQVGKTIDATVKGDTAYSRHIALPLILGGLGLLTLALGLAFVRGMLKKPPAPLAE